MNQPLTIERPVGERETNRSDDLEAVRNALAEHGLCQRTVIGQLNAKFKPDLTAGVRIFQRKTGLEPDGLVIPDGPTAMALGLGSDAAGMSAPAEGKLADDAACAALQELVLVAAEQVASIAEDIKSLEKQRRRLEGELNQIIGTLGRMTDRLRLGIDPRPQNLDAVGHALNNLPNDRDVQQAQAAVRDASQKIREIEDNDEEIAFTEEQRHRAEQRFNERIAKLKRDCTALI